MQTKPLHSDRASGPALPFLSRIDFHRYRFPPLAEMAGLLHPASCCPADYSHPRQAYPHLKYCRQQSPLPQAADRIPLHYQRHCRHPLSLLPAAVLMLQTSPRLHTSQPQLFPACPSPTQRLMTGSCCRPSAPTKAWLSV